ncbi:MAG: Stk1 family PASTA domain-containing Ser/Thr kinase [Bacilli bacterium]
MIQKGQVISERYEILRSIGEGGMANVYLANDIILDRKVAIKILRGDLANDEKFVRRFQREALSASSLSHPNIVEMYDVGEDNGTYFIVMEYVEGRTLKQLLKKRGALTLSEAIDIMLQLTDGIAHAHDSYIIHRDLKPQNIMIKEDGLIKITDFGIAMALNSTQLTQTNSVMGSVHYLPPEQASGKGASVRSDIYSMGILFYELLTGTLPFKGDNAVEIALKHMRDPLPSVKTFNQSIPQSIENIIMKATAKNPKNRYASVKEMHADLLTALDEDRMNEDVYQYKYPEHEQDDTKVIPILKKRYENNNEIEEDSLEDDEESLKEKKRKKLIWILSGILGAIIILLLTIFIIIPKVTDEPDIKIPDVAGMSVSRAEEKLEDLGFKVNLKTKKIASDKYEEGEVVKTYPAIGRSVKKGTQITLYESIGQETYEIEDYTGKNYIEVKTTLTIYGIDVKVEKKTVDNASDYIDKEELIIDQSVKKGTKLKEGDTIILYIPKVDTMYPDMVGEGWTQDEASDFCAKYNLTCTFTEKEASNVAEGTVIEQSRKAGSNVVSGTTMRITIAKAPQKQNSNTNTDQNTDNNETGTDNNQNTN